jgi:tetratricopeptide (TPR) repeat protein
MQSFPRGPFVGALILLVALASSSEGQGGREIARNAFPSVVLVVADSGEGHRGSLGSGFFVQDDLIVTNYHVVKGYSRISVKLVGHKEIYQAKVVTASSAKDLAFLRVIGVQATPLSFGNVREVAVGDEVYAIGNPEGLEATLSQGIVSGNRLIGGNRYFQISAAISRGSSGGPILNKSGEVIGVAVAALRTGQNLNFAIPVSEVTALMNGTPAIAAGADDDDKYIETTTQPKRKLALSPYVKEEITKAIDRVHKQPNSADAHFMLAEIYRRKDIYEGVSSEDAIKEYKRVIQINPEHAQAYFGLAELHRTASFASASIPRENLRNAERETAIRFYRESIRIDPDYTDAHVGLCTTYSYMGRHDEAIAACRLAIRLNPKGDRSYVALGDVYRRAKLFDNAVNAYKAAAALNPYWSSYYFIGEVYEDTDRCEQAIPYYQQAISRDMPVVTGSVSESPYRALLRCYADSGHLEEGIGYFKQLILSVGEKRLREGTTSTVAHYALGMMYAYSGDTKAALDQYKILKAQGKGTPAEFAGELFSELYK